MSFKNWQDKKFSVQNLTRCEIFGSKYDGVYFFKFKIWHVIKFSIQTDYF